MYIGLSLSDYAFATDKWYWQILIYILSIILTVIDFLLTFIYAFYKIDGFRGSDH